jgi:myosin heavy subunit
LISGESGAGKTVSSNFLVQQLAELGKVRKSKNTMNISIIQ